MNYIGSKYSLLDFLHSTIADVTGYKDGDQYIFADLFAGTGVVGASYRKRGCMVISNDIQYYSYVLNKYDSIQSHLCMYGASRTFPQTLLVTFP